MFGVVQSPFDWEHWNKARKMLEASANRAGDTTIEDIEGTIEANMALLWATDDASFVGITQLFNAPKGLQCLIWHLAGEGDWLGKLKDVENYARREGCVSIEGAMRPGFERILTDWKKTAVVLEKGL